MNAQQKSLSFSTLEKDFVHPPNSAKPWVFWYWMHGNVSKEGITADIKAMKEVGLGGAYLMFIQDTLNPPFYANNARQLSDNWNLMVAFAIQEAKRVGLELGIHISDGFALAGGPWITPALSMQKLVWSNTEMIGGETIHIQLPQPIANENFYQDIAVYAYPTLPNSAYNTRKIKPIITTSTNEDGSFLTNPLAKRSFKMTSNGYIQYYFEQPFTCNQIQIRTNGNNYQSHRLIIQTSNDGQLFKTITRLIPPRHGWQDTDEAVTHAIPSTTAQYFRFVYDKEGTEPGAEDLDNAKWSPNLKLSSIELSGAPIINQYESKNGSVWRISNETTTEQVFNNQCIPINQLINISSFYKNGILDWEAPKGNWTIIRIGHTSTGHTNETGGGAKGLEADKFNPIAIQLQLNQWFGKIYGLVDSVTAKKVIKILHIDSWECGSQNWSQNFAIEFRKRRGYDLMPYLPVMTGLPVESVAKSELVLLDIRKTIAELIKDVFFETIAKYAAAKKLTVTAESVAPTMMSDGMLHYAKVGIPMGEFWNNSPTHDKPNDMLDAISAAHIYGKNIIQAEAFTTVRMDWNEHPGNLKVLGDRNFALGINKMVFHVFAHNPSLVKKPGMTLDGVGIYFQRDQTWFKQSKAWVDYLARCQYLLQKGKPIVDIAVFTGDDLPSRSVLPDRLVTSLPGIFGEAIVNKEKSRLQNTGQPQRQIPDGVGHAANMADPENWVNAFNGYQYDAINPDALLHLAKVQNGRIVLPSGACYKILIVPGDMKMNPNNRIRKETIQKIISLVQEGGTILLSPVYIAAFKSNGIDISSNTMTRLGKGFIYLTPYLPNSFHNLGVEKDVEIGNDTIARNTIAYTHRKTANEEIYFIANQKPSMLQIPISFAIQGMQPELWDPINGSISIPIKWSTNKGRTIIDLTLEANSSILVVFKKLQKIAPISMHPFNIQPLNHSFALDHDWTLQIDSSYIGSSATIKLNKLSDLTNSNLPGIKYFSGTMLYTTHFNFTKSNKVIVSIGEVANIATIKINGKEIGTLWTAPYSLDITEGIKQGDNTIEIMVANTWHNRLIGDHLFPNNKITNTTAPYRLKEKLTPTGLLSNPIIQYQ
jgi:hypothetical protein